MSNNIYSDLKIFNFPKKIESFKSGEVTAPIYVRFKPTNRCNHACSFCTYSDGTKRPKDRASEHLQSGMHSDMIESDVMPLEKAIEIIDNLRDMGTEAITFSGGGEPLLHKDIVEMMRRCLVNGLDLSIITNGQALKGTRACALALAKWVRVSIDYTSAAGMAASRNVPERFFDEVLDNLKEFSKLKSPDCDLGVNYIVTRYNCEGLIEFTKTLKACGVENVRFSPVYVQNFQEYHQPIKDLVESQLAAIQETICDDTFSVNTTYVLDHPSKSPIRNLSKCLYMQTTPVIGADLGVYTCHNGAFSDKHKIGSLKYKTFKEMWFSEETKNYFNSFNPKISCANMECANHNKVDLFNKLAEMIEDSFV